MQGGADLRRFGKWKLLEITDQPTGAEMVKDEGTAWVSGTVNLVQSFQ